MILANKKVIIMGIKESPTFPPPMPPPEHPPLTPQEKTPALFFLGDSTNP